MRILVSAFSCGPGWGSEPGIGWNTVEQISRRHEVWVMVEAGWRKRMAHKFDASAHPRVHFVWVRIPLLDKLVDGGPLDCGPGWLLYYTLWQFAALRTARRLHAEWRFDLAHHVTFGKHSVPSHLHQLGIPFIFGPVGGAEMAPSPAFYSGFGWKTRLAEQLRLLHVKLVRFDPWLRACVRRADLVVGVTGETADELRRLGAQSTTVLHAISLSDEEARMLGKHEHATGGAAPTLIFVGRLLAWKGVHLAIEAMAQCDATHLRLRIIGDGPARRHLEKLAATRGIASRVEFTGGLVRDEVLKATASADGLLFPSLHDSGGYAVIEAMAAGLPVICLDLGGPGLFVADDCGWKIRATTPAQTIAGLASALDEFAGTPAVRTRRGEAARLRCLQHFTASAHGAAVEQCYRSILPPGSPTTAI